MTLRSVEVLQAVDMIAAEDTRHSRTLLNHYEITTPVISFHEHSGEGAAMALAQRIVEGEGIALISDAGTPLVSDPGYQLVRAVQALNMPVVPLPGPCAAITALSAAGLPTHSFQFVGFLPSKQNARRTRLDALKSSDSTIILYEAPHRILDLLDDVVERSLDGSARGRSRESHALEPVACDIDSTKGTSPKGFAATIPSIARGLIVPQLSSAPPSTDVGHGWHPR